LGYDTVHQLLFQAGWLALAFGSNTLGLFIVELFPRHIFLTIGYIGCATTLIIEAAIQANFLHSNNLSALAAGVAMLFLFEIFFGACLDAPTFLYATEIFPTHLRAQGLTIGICTFCSINVLWSQVSPIAFAAIGWKYYLVFIIITGLAAPIVYFLFPDTRGLALEEVAALFGDEDLVVIHERDIQYDTQKHEIVKTAEYTDNNSD
jgi:hypothetical protein